MPSPPSSSVSSSPVSLKGITSTNDDPDACARCSGPFLPISDSKIYGIVKICCGKRICVDCNKSGGSSIGADRAKRCSLCNAPAFGSDREIFGALKKHAKKGAAWGQFHLGQCYDRAIFILRSDHFEAKRWYDKAAKQGHPEAMYCLGYFFLEGIGGCAIDLSKTRELAKKAVSLDYHLAELCRNLLVQVASRVDSNEAKSILVPLAERGMASAQNNLGVLFFREGDLLHAKLWFEAAALQDEKAVTTAARNILVCCEELLDLPECNFWFNIVSKLDMVPPTLEERNIVEDIGRKLRKLRDRCGGCGGVLETKRRQYCKQCKTYCYCSRECQKLHWNRPGGHRSECMGVEFLEEKMKAAQQQRRRVGTTTSISAPVPQIAP